MKKRLFFFLLTVILLVSTFALAASASSPAGTVAEGTCGEGLTWVFDEAGALTISGTGVMTDFSSLSDVPWAAYRDSIRYINVTYGVGTIGDYAFAGCTVLEGTQITLPTGVYRIGDHAFEGCSNMTGIVLPSTLGSIYDKAFKDCVALTDITIPVSVDLIYPEAFSGCSNLTIHGYQNSRAEKYATANSIPFAAIQTDIASGTCGEGLTWELDKTCTLVISGTGAMTNWGSASAVPWYSYIKSICSIVIEEGVTTIGDYAFYDVDCTGTDEIVIPEGVTSIGNHAFESSGFSIIRLPDTLTYIGDSAFAFTSVTGIAIPASVERFGAVPFYDCVLQHITFAGKDTPAFDYFPKISPTVMPVWVYGIPGSPAQSFAQNNGFNFVVLTMASGTCGEKLTWKLDYAGTLTISGTGAMMNYVSNNQPWRAYMESITSAVIEEGVTSIGSYAFANCANLKIVTLPDSLTSIGRMAFFYCESLASLHIPAGVTEIGRWAFSECTALPAITVAEENLAFSANENGVLFNKDKTTLIYYPDGKTDGSYTVPDGVLVIGQDAFSYCDFSTVVIPDGVTTLESKAFEECANLTKVIIPASVTSIDSAFERCTALTIHGYVGSFAELYARIYGIPFVVLPTNGTCGEALTWNLDSTGTLTISGTGAMTNFNSNVSWKAFLESITSVVIEEGVTSIGDYAFSGCTNLTSITFPEGLIAIGRWAFNECVNLKSITLPDSLTSIGDAAFIYCESITALHIPAGVTEIGRWAFSECISLPAFTVAEGNTAFSVDAEGVLFNKDKTVLVAYPDGKTDSSYAIPEGVTTVGAFAFNLCDSLTSVTLPNSLTTLETGAFEDCIGLTSVTIPAGVVSIGRRAFEACTSLPAFTVAEGNTAFVEIDGVLLSADKTRLVSYPAGKPTANYTIPDGVTAINSLLFYQCSYLTNITIPSSVTSIGISAFSGCTNLTIYGYSGSTAETYAASNNIPFVVLQTETIDITVNVPTSLGSAVTAPEGGWKVGTNTFAVKAENPCVIAVSYDGGKTYTKLTATANDDGGYDFTAENMTADTIVAVALRGDANGDGKISNADVARAKATYLGKISLDSLGKIITDANGDGKISNADVARVKAVYLGKTSLGWN